jgi:hypothetical protein
MRCGSSEAAKRYSGLIFRKVKPISVPVLTSNRTDPPYPEYLPEPKLPLQPGFPEGEAYLDLTRHRGSPAGVLDLSNYLEDAQSDEAEESNKPQKVRGKRSSHRRK